MSEASGLLGAGIVLAAVWLAGGRYRGGTRALVMLVTGTLLTAQTVLIPGGANSFPAGQMLPASSDHAATLLLLLIACLALQGGVRVSGVWWVIVWLALAVASVGDPLAIVVGGGSIIVVAGGRTWPCGGARHRAGTRRCSWSAHLSPPRHPALLVGDPAAGRVHRGAPARGAGTGFRRQSPP